MFPRRLSWLQSLINRWIKIYHNSATSESFPSWNVLDLILSISGEAFAFDKVWSWLAVLGENCCAREEGEEGCLLLYIEGGGDEGLSVADP